MAAEGDPAAAIPSQAEWRETVRSRTKYMYHIADGRQTLDGAVAAEAAAVLRTPIRGVLTAHKNVAGGGGKQTVSHLALLPPPWPGSHSTSAPWRPTTP